MAPPVPNDGLDSIPDIMLEGRSPNPSEGRMPRGELVDYSTDIMVSRGSHPLPSEGRLRDGLQDHRSEHMVMAPSERDTVGTTPGAGFDEQTEDPWYHDNPGPFEHGLGDLARWWELWEQGLWTPGETRGPNGQAWFHMSPGERARMRRSGAGGDDDGGPVAAEGRSVRTPLRRATVGIGILAVLAGALHLLGRG